MKLSNMTDKQFSDYLNNKSKNWYYKSSGPYVAAPYTTYFDHSNNIIAVVFYDNKKCAREIYI